MFEKYLKRVIAGESLNTEEAYTAAKMLLHDNIPELKAAAFLSAIRTRKEKAAELSGFVQALVEEAVTVEADHELIDTCGTGGDGLGTFNVSTAAALIVAGCGVPVAKHGNRAASGRVGSADVMEALGVNVQLSPDEARRLLDKVGITFLYAPNYHPILKQVGNLRRQLGIATIFNFLGPLLNPMKLSYQIMGIADRNLQEALTQTLNYLGRKRCMVVHAENGMDEISPTGITQVYEIQQGLLTTYEIDPKHLKIEPFSLEAIKGGDLQANARILRQVLEGEIGPYRETVAINAAAALVTADRAGDLGEGMQMAYEAIDSGRAKKTLLDMISFSKEGAKAC